MIEAYCGTCDAITSQSVINILFGALPTGQCTQCQRANPLVDTLPFLLDLLLGDELQEYQGKRASFEERNAR